MWLATGGQRVVVGRAGTSSAGNPTGGPRLIRPARPTSALLDVLEAYREGLALARRAGMSWFEAERAAYEAAMALAPEDEREEWASVLYETRTEWMRAYERRPTGCPL